MSDQRNAFGFPTALRMAMAKQTAATAAARKQDRDCNCHLHQQARDAERLQSVQNIVAAFDNKGRSA